MQEKLLHTLSRAIKIQDDSYINSFLYYKITGRKSSWIYKDEHSFLVVCQHPHDVNTLLVFAEGANQADYTLTAKVLQHLYRQGHNIQLARYTQHNIETLYNAVQNLPHNIVHSITPFEDDVMDWNYPVHVLDTKKVSLMEGADFNRIRAKYKKAQNNIRAKFMSRAIGTKEMRATLKFWEGNMIISEKETEDMSEFYQEFFKIIETYTGRWEGMIFYEGKRPVGFSVWEPISDDTANSFINLGDTTITGLSDFQMVSVCKHLSDQGIQYLNVGGSETPSLDAFKRKYMPCKSIELVSAHVRYKDFNLPSDVSYMKFV